MDFHLYSKGYGIFFFFIDKVNEKPRPSNIGYWSMEQNIGNYQYIVILQIYENNIGINEYNFTKFKIDKN